MWNRTASVALLISLFTTLSMVSGEEDGVDTAKKIERTLTSLRTNNDMVLAIKTVRTLGDDGVLEVIRLLDSQKLEERHLAASVLAEIKPKSQKAIFDLAKILANCDPVTCTLVKTALELNKNDGEAIVDLLSAWVESHDEKIEESSVSALAHVGRYSTRVMPVLMAELQSKNNSPLRKMYLCSAIGYIGPAAKEFVPKLLELAADPELSLNIAEAISRIGKDAVPALIESIRIGGRNMRVYSIFVFMQIDLKPEEQLETGPNAGQAVPVLIKQLEDTADRLILAPESDPKEDDIKMRISIIKLVGFIGKDAVGALSSLKKLQENGNERLRPSASEAIRKIEAAMDLKNKSN